MSWVEILAVAYVLVCVVWAIRLIRRRNRQWICIEGELNALYGEDQIRGLNLQTAQLAIRFGWIKRLPDWQERREAWLKGGK